MNIQPTDEKPAWFQPKAILAAYLDGKSTKEISQELGTSRERLVHWLVRSAEEDWKAAQFLRAVRRKEEAEDAMDMAADPLQLRKAEGKLKSAQWDLERVCRRIYGTDAPDTPNEHISINIHIGRPEDQSRVIEGEKAGPSS